MQGALDKTSVGNTVILMKTAAVLEELEPRIAPAGVVLANGGNLLSAGDQGSLSEPDADSDATVLVKCTAGKALVFWDSTASQIKGISVSNGTNIEILGNVHGDIVTNLLPNGLLTDTDGDVTNGLDGGKLLASSIAGIKTTPYFDSKGNAQNGDVGRIVAGGSIANVKLSGDLRGVYAGDGIFDAIASAALPDGSAAPANGTPGTRFEFKLGMNFDQSGMADISTMTLKMSDASFAPNASIIGVEFASGFNTQFFAGDGASGSAAGVGGSVSKLSFVGAIVDTEATGFFVGKSYTISAGDGGDSNAEGKAAGTGGNINTVSETGSNGNVYIHAGAGGDSSTVKGTGGIGGSVSLLDLQGAVTHYDIASGPGGDGASGGLGGGVSNTNIANKGPISLVGPFLGPMGGDTGELAKDFFFINRSSGEMTLIDGTTLADKGIIAPLASGPVNAITTDLNDDGYLDVAVLYADGSLGTLINNDGDGTFGYTVTDLGFKPAFIVAGHFMADGNDYPELAIASTDRLTTTLRLYSSENPDAGAASFISDPNEFEHFTFKRGNLADLVGGSPPGDYGYGMQLNPEEKVRHDDVVLAFSNGILQGVVSLGDRFDTKYPDPSNPKTNLLAPTALIGGGIRDVDFNYASPGSQTLAVVNKAGTEARLVVIDKAPLPPPDEGETPVEGDTPVEGEPTPVVSDQFVFNVKEPLPVPDGSGTILQAAWCQASLGDSDKETAALMLLASKSASSSMLFFDNYDSTLGNMTLTANYGTDHLMNSVANDFLFSPFTGADSYVFTTGYVTLAFAHQSFYPGNSIEPMTAFALPFQGKDIRIATGAGGNATTGAGGNGGDIRSLNFDSNTATVTTGMGGESTSGAGGNGGSIYNAASFYVSSTLISPAMAVTDTLLVTCGNGADVTGTGTSSRGGNGGSITGIKFNSTGHVTKDGIIFGDIRMRAGDGGDSEMLAAGIGGSIASTTITNAKDVFLIAGVGGQGLSKASGGKGGSINGLLGGDTAISGTRQITGNIVATAGDGGHSVNATAGGGGNITTVNVKNMVTPTAGFTLTAGLGGNSTGMIKQANGGAGGSIIGVVAEKLLVNPTMSAGNGGTSVNGAAGSGGSIKTLKYDGGLIDLTCGVGGVASGAGIGGLGGSIVGVNASIKGSGYMTFEAGLGGDARGAGGVGGAGGSVTNAFFKLNPDDRSSGDETLGVTVKSGHGGNGSTGGKGGSISGVACEGVYDNSANDGFVTVIDSIAMMLVAGDGGTGAIGDGGAGGSVSLSKTLLGLSQIDEHSTRDEFRPGDEALRIYAGDGGDGQLKGGAGGSVSGVKAANPKANALGDPMPFNLLSGAFVRSGDGGDGTLGDAGAAGAIGNVRLSVERHGSEATGNVRILSGTGGDSVSGKGGAGGTIQNSYFTSVNGNNEDGYAILLQSGDGGNGAKSGGNGGNLANLTVSIPTVGINGAADGTDPDIYSAVLLAGNGGDGLGISKSAGGAGGSISGINQNKDVYGLINLLQAGSGGGSSADTVGAVGGSVSNVKTSGAIGAQKANGTPQGISNAVPVSAVIDGLVPDHRQGIFAGLGGKAGVTAGANGSVTGISAPWISAIGAAAWGAGSNEFAAASVVNKIASLLVAYDVDGSRTYTDGDGFLRALKFDAAKDLVSLDPALVSNAALIARTTPFVNP